MLVQESLVKHSPLDFNSTRNERKFKQKRQKHVITSAIHVVVLVGLDHVSARIFGEAAAAPAKISYR
jgi:uncharacterized protein YvpB